MAIQNFDQLNIFKRRSEPYEEYFRVMKLPPNDLKKRIRLAIDMEEAFATFFEVIMMGVIDEITVKQQLMYDIYNALGDEKRFETALDGGIVCHTYHLYICILIQHRSK